MGREDWCADRATLLRLGMKDVADGLGGARAACRPYMAVPENEGFTIKVHDPYVKNFEYKISSLEDSVKNSDCIILITDHTVFKEIKKKLSQLRCLKCNYHITNKLRIKLKLFIIFLCGGLGLD
jgi:UDP-glucose 6-dehydrogenase